MDEANFAFQLGLVQVIRICAHDQKISEKYSLENVVIANEFNESQ